jgi:hypothetical protein
MRLDRQAADGDDPPRTMRSVAIFVVMCGLAAPARAQSPGLDEILDKASEYVERYERTFVGVVSEESYRQQVRGGRTGTDLRGFPIEGPSQRRDLKSDVLLVRPPAADRWIQFRDVFEVDGKPVSDRDDRLTKLFLQPSADAWRQEADIAAASSRYNIGAVNRTVNLPVLALSVLEPQNRVWFTFKIGKRSGATVELEYQEEDRGRTMIHTNDNQPMRAHGRFTVDTATGHVRASLLATETATLRAQIEVTYGAEPAVDMLVPREMRERYTLKDGSTIDGRATYAKFRRYQVKVDERIGTVKK